jgi:hypothetical protein
VGIVGDGNDGLGLVAGGLDEVGLTGTNGLALQVNVDTLLLGLTLLDGVLLDTLDEVLAGAGVLDVLNADVDALLEVAVVDLLVEDDTDGGLGDVVDDTGLTVVDLVGHTVQTVRFLSLFRVSRCPWCVIAVGVRAIALNGNIGSVLTPSGRHR